MRVLTGAVLAILAGTLSATAKDTRFWNLTANTVTSLQISLPGKDAWGEDQVKNDKDGAVDHDERLRIVGVKTGPYDVKLKDATRTCIVRNVMIVEGKVFTIDEAAMIACR